MMRFFAVVERDLRKFVRNPMVMLLSILMPILYLIILGNSFQGELKHLPLAVVKMDGGIYGGRVLERLRSIQAGPRTLELFEISDQGFAMTGLRTGVFNTVMDRFLGVDESYLITPLKRSEIVMGLVVSGLFITTILAFLVLFISSLILEIHLWQILTIRTLFGVFSVIVLSTLSLQGLLFVVLSRADHPRIVGFLGGFLNVILFFPSGSIYPTESFPKWLRMFSNPPRTPTILGWSA